MPWGRGAVVVPHPFEPVDEPLPGRGLDELLQQADALTGAWTEDVGADATDRHQPADAVRILDGEVDADAATHRVADDVHLLDAERVQEGRNSAECGNHRVATEVAGDPA